MKSKKADYLAMKHTLRECFFESGEEKHDKTAGLEVRGPGSSFLAAVDISQVILA